MEAKHRNHLIVPLTLLVMAAGVGSRYGGLKQVESVDEQGQLLLEYSVYNAAKAGFNRVVVIIRPEMESLFQQTILPRFSSRLSVECVCQKSAKERKKPWGTGHAVWSAREVIDGPFALINADDYYGLESFQILSAFLRKKNRHEFPTFALMGHLLEETLSEYGAVSRGVCRVDTSFYLEAIEEFSAIQRKSGILQGVDGKGRQCVLSGKEWVSLNAWGFLPEVFSLLNNQWESFFEVHAKNPRAEFYLPEAIHRAVEKKEVSVRLFPVKEPYLGMTYFGDLLKVKAEIKTFCARGQYPVPLWATL